MEKNKMIFDYSDLLSEKELLENLCVYDVRNPDNILSIVDKPDKDFNCFCDSCFYGNSKLANNSLLLIDKLKSYQMLLDTL